MKRLILAITIVYLINKVTAYEYTDKDYGEERKLNEERPHYNLNDAPKLFVKFVRDYNKKYNDEEDYYKHYYNFVKNLEEIINLNKSNRDAVFDINMFADMGDEESDDGGFQ